MFIDAVAKPKIATSKIDRIMNYVFSILNFLEVMQLKFSAARVTITRKEVLHIFGIENIKYRQFVLDYHKGLTMSAT